MSKLIYTETDEAPMLATYSLLPIIQRFAKPMGIEVSIIINYIITIHNASRIVAILAYRLRLRN